MAKTAITREEILKEIKISLGFVEREDDEFTAKEIMECFNITELRGFFKREEIKYTRRKAMANGRRQYVYRFNVIIENTEKEQ